jgi:hypothetical protein
MSTAELKNDLHRMIVETQDNSILEQISNYFSLIIAEKNIWEGLSDAEKKQIESGVKDMQTNRTLSNEEVRAKVRLILNQK